MQRNNFLKRNHTKNLETLPVCLGDSVSIHSSFSLISLTPSSLSFPSFYFTHWILNTSWITWEVSVVTIVKGLTEEMTVYSKRNKDEVFWLNIHTKVPVVRTHIYRVTFWRDRSSLWDFIRCTVTTRPPPLTVPRPMFRQRVKVLPINGKPTWSDQDTSKVRVGVLSIPNPISLPFWKITPFTSWGIRKRNSHGSY